MTNLIDRVADLLFPEAGNTTLDIKFFCGGMNNVSAHDLADQVLRALTQVSGGSAVLAQDLEQS